MPVPRQTPLVKFNAVQRTFLIIFQPTPIEYWSNGVVRTFDFLQCEFNAIRYIFEKREVPENTGKRGWYANQLP